MRVLVLTALIVAASATQNFFRLPQPYSYSCLNDLCVKEDRTSALEYKSLTNCQLTCGQYGSVWPRPTGETQISDDVVHFNPYNMQVTKIAASNQRVQEMLEEATQYFRRNIHFNHPDFPEAQKTPYTDDVRAPLQSVELQQNQRQFNRPNFNQFNQRQQQFNQFNNQRQQQQQQQQQKQQFTQNEFSQFETQTYEQWERYSPFMNQEYNAGVERQQVNIEITVTSPEERFSIEDTAEDYNLVIQTIDDQTTVTILATTYYGARHALESLSQLIAYDDNNEALMIVRNVKIQDQPQYKYRGLMLDTGRNYYKPEELMSLLDSMSQNKMNVFHWHITDAASFPLYSNRLPQMAYYGSYSPRKVYYPEDIRQIIEYAQLRGVTVIPELDAPAHAAAGWEWGEKEGKGTLVLCTKQTQNEPWFEVGKEPPSGQLNPVNPELYPILGELYSDMLESFDPEYFHMGGDDVSFKCWQNAPEIKEYMAANQRDTSSRELFELWNTFQSNAYAKLQESSKGRRVTPMIHSSSFARNYINKENYIIQLNEKANDSQVADYVNNGFKVIFSNPDQWRLDCAGTNWYGDKAASCPSVTPTWQHFYGNSPLNMLYNLGVSNARNDLPENRPSFNQQSQLSNEKTPRQLVLGGSASLWSSETDGLTFQTKIWPRVSALAERLWSDPIEENPAFQNTERRLNIQRARMVNRGIHADPIQPEFCVQDESACYDREQYQYRLRSGFIPQ